MAKKQDIKGYFLMGSCAVNQSASIKHCTLTFRKDYEETNDEFTESSAPKKLGEITIENVADIGEIKRENEWSETFECSVKEKFKYAPNEDKAGKHNITVQINDCPVGSILEKLDLAVGETMKLAFKPSKQTKEADLDKADVKLASK